MKDELDGTTFLNYLAFMITEDAIYESDVDAMLSEHRTVIERGLAQFPVLDPLVLAPRQKYVWAARYHDRVCSDFERPDLKISP